MNGMSIYKDPLHFIIQETIQQGIISIEHVRTREQLKDNQSFKWDLSGLSL